MLEHDGQEAPFRVAAEPATERFALLAGDANRLPVVGSPADGDAAVRIHADEVAQIRGEVDEFRERGETDRRPRPVWSHIDQRQACDGLVAQLVPRLDDFGRGERVERIEPTPGAVAPPPGLRTAEVRLPKLGPQLSFRLLGGR